MTALFKLSLRMYGRNWKRNLFNILSVTVAMLFIMSLLMLYKNYERAQIENAYAYNGTWDFKITNASANMQLTADAIPDVISTALVNASLTAQLDLIEDKDRDGPSADIASHWLLSLIELGPGGSDAMSVSLIDGTWPSRSDEIVIPRDFIYAGKKHLSGDYQIGDTVELAVGKRLLPDQTPTQHAQLSNDESFDVIDTRSYRITGVLQGDYRRVGEFVVPGYIGTDDVFENQDNMTLYVQTHLKDSIGLQNIRYNLVETLGVDESAIEANEAITVAVSLIETSNVGKIYRSAGIALIVLLLILVGTIIVTSQAFNFQINEQAFSIMMVNGSGRLFVTLSLLLQNMFTFIISGSLAVILSISLTQFFSNYVSQLISEQGERYQFTAQIYVSYILLTLLLIAILVCVLPFFFTRRIDLRNLRSHAAGQSQYKHAKNMQIETDVPSWMRTYLRNKANFITLTISILISLLALSIGLVATSTIAAKTREVTDQFVADFYFLKLMNPGDPDDMDTIIDGLPDHVSALKYYANNVAFELPNHKMTPELRFFFGNTNDSVLLSSSVYSIDEDLFEFINGSKLTTFEEFSKDNIAIFFNRAKVAMDYSVNPSAETDQSGYIMLDDNQQSSQYIIIDMTTFEPGDRIVLSAVSGTPVSIDLPLAGTTNKYFGETLRQFTCWWRLRVGAIIQRNNCSRLILFNNVRFNDQRTKGRHGIIFADSRIQVQLFRSRQQPTDCFRSHQRKHPAYLYLCDHGASFHHCTRELLNHLGI